MTVKELKEAIAELDDDLAVFVRGYEGGVDYAQCKGKDEEIIEVALDVNANTWYYGNHEKVDEDEKEQYKNYKIVKGIQL
jgi:hypothetical protein